LYTSNDYYVISTLLFYVYYPIKTDQEKV